MRCFLILVVVLTAGSVIAAEPSASNVRWSFEDVTVGKLPAGWSSTKTGQGESSLWKVAEDVSAPNGSKVLAQTSESPGPMFNLCVAEDTSFKDVALAVSFKAMKGKIDQGGGLVWRYLDSDNYYIARFNPLEDNYRLYKVVAGKRTQLATKEGLKASSDEWHTLIVKMKADEIECSLDGKKYLEATDGTFTKPGKVGLWTKADAQTHFDDFTVSAVK